MQTSVILAALTFTLLSGSVSLLLFNFYRPQKGPFFKDEGEEKSLLAFWSFLPSTIGRSPYLILIFVSALGLFLELLLIRWVSSEIRIFAFFKNFVLIACFLGFGLGSSLCRRSINLLPMVIPLVVVALLIKLPWDALRSFVGTLPNYLGSMSEVHLWGVPSIPMTWTSLGLLVAACATICPLFALLALVFIPIGQLVGWCVENSPNGIQGYTLNIAASLAGILLFTLLCFWHQPPWVWLTVAGLVALVLFWRPPALRWTVVAGFGLCVGLACLSSHPGTQEYWSPYQKLTLLPQQTSGSTHLYHLYTNDTWYQQIIDLSPAFVASHPELFHKVPAEFNAYNLPYRFFPNPASVLILGAGTGNDAAAALRNGAQSVVAVEIDPLILRLGEQLHFEKPYDSPRVRTVLEDARSYVQNSNDRFDLVVFSLLDSHTTSSHYSNIRIDNYVYTVEALKAARRLLLPQGVFMIKFQVETPWIAGRLQALMAEVFGRPPIQMRADNNSDSTVSFFIEASPSNLQQALSDKSFAAYGAAQGALRTEHASLTTDDWPYFYQHEPGIPASVLAISVALFSLCAWALRQTGTKLGAIHWHFFFLGAGFLLMEVQIISKMALLFGTTWIVNAIVISGLLLLIVASNGLIKRFPRFPVHQAYWGLFISMSVSYFVPLDALFYRSIWLKGIGATLVLCLPVFFAGIIFIRSFAEAGFTGAALGSNLMGSLLGGLLESMSYWTGLKSLLLLAGVLYLASCISLRPKSAVGCIPSSVGPTRA